MLTFACAKCSVSTRFLGLPVEEEWVVGGEQWRATGRRCHSGGRDGVMAAAAEAELSTLVNFI